MRLRLIGGGNLRQGGVYCLLIERDCWLEIRFALHALSGSFQDAIPITCCDRDCAEALATGEALAEDDTVSPAN